MPEAFICDYIRTPVGRFGGALSGVQADDLGLIPTCDECDSGWDFPNR